MDLSTLYIGILPILAFVIIDSFSSKRAAILSAMGMALLEVVFTIVKYHTIDSISVVAVVLALAFGFISWKMNNDIYFKLQPAILNFFFGISFLFFYHILEKPIMILMAEKYFPDMIDKLLASKGIPKAYFTEILRLMSRDLGWWLIAHAVLTAYAALKWSKWVWFVIRVPLFYLMLIAAAFSFRFY
jgi:intracellular septation protein